jgi:hypothetical protein
MKINKNNRLLPGAVALVFFLVGCGPDTIDQTANPTDASPLSSIQFLNTKPEGVRSVQAAKAELKAGDAALVFGQIGGVQEPFLEGYAGFVLGDTEIVFCNEMGEDHCPTPWDACCEDRDVLKASRASVNFVDERGQVIPVGMRGLGGLVELSEVVVKGVIAQTSTPDNLIIEATGIYLPR